MGLLTSTLAATASIPEKAVIYAVEAFGATTSHITEITRGLDEGDAIFYHSFVTWEEYLKKEKKEKEEPKPQP